MFVFWFIGLLWRDVFLEYIKLKISDPKNLRLLAIWNRGMVIQYPGIVIQNPGMVIQIL